MSVNTPSAEKKSPGFIPSSLAGLYEKRWLIGYFVQRDLSKSYRGSFLGLFWIFLGPLLMIILYTLIFSEVLDLRFRQTESVTNFGLYLYCGLIPFLAYAETVNKCVGIIKTNAALVQKVVFPLQILPFSTAATAVINQVFQFGALAVLAVLLGNSLHWTAVLLPVIMIPQLLFYLGLGYLGAVVGTYLPDLQETLKAIVRATFFMTPIIWPVEKVAGREYLSLIVDLNPLAYLVAAYRSVVLDGQIPEISSFLTFSLFSGALFVVGFVLFNHVKQRFADLI